MKATLIIETSLLSTPTLVLPTVYFWPADDWDHRCRKKLVAFPIAGAPQYPRIEQVYDFPMNWTEHIWGTRWGGNNLTPNTSFVVQAEGVTNLTTGWVALHETYDLERGRDSNTATLLALSNPPRFRRQKARSITQVDTSTLARTAAQNAGVVVEDKTDIFWGAYFAFWLRENIVGDQEGIWLSDSLTDTTW